MSINYKIINDISFHINAPLKLCNEIIRLYKNQERIIIDYGDIKTNISWKERNDIIGRIGRSTGGLKIPLLIYNNRSLGGSAILTNGILSIKTSKGKILLYKNEVV